MPNPSLDRTQKAGFEFTALTLAVHNKVKWISGRLRTTFLLKVGLTVTSNYAFKPTAGGVFRCNQPPLACGGLPRR